MDAQQYALYAASAAAAYGVYRLVKVVANPSPLRELPGPASTSWLWGNFKAIRAASKEDSVDELFEQWAGEHGHTYMFRGLFSGNRLFTMDSKALSHILMRSDVYWKPEPLRIALSRMMGEGVLVIEGDKHRAQRRLLNPAFGPGQIRELTGIFLDKANELREKWGAKVGDGKEPVRLDVMHDLSKTTLDIIGLAGFNYKFDALARPDDDPDELSVAFDKMFSAAQDVTLWTILQHFFPILNNVPTQENRNIWHCRGIMDRVGEQLLREKKAAVASGQDETSKTSRDLLSLLVRANMASDTAHRMSDKDVLAQIPTFLLAGHETTSTGLSWILWALSQRPDIQTRLRDELRALPLPTSACDSEPLAQDDVAALDKLPLLDAVVRESMRLYAPVTGTSRVAVRDDEIPVSAPYRDRKGVLRDTIRVSKGDFVPIPIIPVNRSTDIWGEDAHEWNPDRWLQGVPEASKTVPGVWGPLLTFINGSHACIGYKFSLIETKIILHALVSEFSFALAFEPSDMMKRHTGIVMRPNLRSEKEKGPQLPLLIERVPL